MVLPPTRRSGRASDDHQAHQHRLAGADWRERGRCDEGQASLILTAQNRFVQLVANEKLKAWHIIAQCRICSIGRPTSFAPSASICGE